MPVEIDELNISLALEPEAQEAQQQQEESPAKKSGGACSKESDDAQETLSPDEIKDLIQEMIEKSLARSHW